MCELLGISFNKLVSPTFSFAGLLTQAHHHKNGWGLGSYPDGSKSAQVFKEPINGFNSPLANFISAPRRLRSKTFVGHIRRASRGGNIYDNTHPFNRFYCYREWLFAHNGTLRNTDALQSKFLPLGQTDSEKAFCYLLSKMSERRLRPTRQGTYVGFDSNAIAGIKEILLDINTRGDGPFNCIFTDGTYLFCYRDKRGSRDLYYLERKPPFQRTVMRDTELEIDLTIEKSDDESGVIVASDRLTSEDWISFAPGELKVWKNGSPVAVQPLNNKNITPEEDQIGTDHNRLWANIQLRLDQFQPQWRSRIEGFGQVKAIEERINGKNWNDAEIFEGILKSVLSSNTDWSKIERVLPELKNLFDGFSLESYARLSESDIKNRFVPWFKERKAGSLTLTKSLVNLSTIAELLVDWSTKNGSAENYFLSLMEHVQGDPKRAAMKIGLPSSSYKLPGLGVALAAETLRNIGFDLVKPDRHILRAAGSFGLVRFANWKDRAAKKPPVASTSELLQTMTSMEKLAQSVGEYAVLVDNAIWLLCAKSGSNFSNDDLSNLAY